MRRFRVTRPISTVLHMGAVLLVAGTLCLTANAPVSAHRTQAALPTLHWIWDGPLDNVESSYGTNLVDVNAGLVHLLPNNTVAPDLATWTISPNHLVYTFTIRKNARFSNGHFVTARDAEFSLKRFLSPTAPYGLIYLRNIRGAEAFAARKTRNLSGVKVLGTRTLQITIIKPQAYFLGILTRASLVFDPSVVTGKNLGIPSNQFKSNYLDTTCSGNQGAGPFKFVCDNGASSVLSFYPGQEAKGTLVPNPYYYGHKPRIRLELLGPPFASSFDPYKSYLQGKVDETYIPDPYFHRWRGKSKEYIEFAGSGVTYLTPNVRLAPFNNVHCRRAVAYAIDREFLAQNILGGLSRAHYAIAPPGMLGYYTGTNNPHYNPAKARDELAKCPGRATPFELAYFHGNDNVVSAIVRMLNRVNMNVSPKPLADNEWNTVINEPLVQSHTQLIHSGWAADYPDPQGYCSVLLRSGQPINIGGWHNTAYDRLVDKSDVTLNRKKRAQLYIRAQHIALDQGAMISLYNNLNHLLLKPYVHGLVGSEHFGVLVPKNGDWANVSVSTH